jgi:GMP synthase-like glutamine amidotransferase
MKTVMVGVCLGMVALAGVADMSVEERKPKGTYWEPQNKNHRFTQI